MFLPMVDTMVKFAGGPGSSNPENPRYKAKQWLQYISRSPFNVLCAAMLADASDEAMSPLRFLDEEGHCITAVHQELRVFLNRVNRLFGAERKCLESGYTALMVEFLREPMMLLIDNRPCHVGGPKAADIDKCFAHMRAWLKLAIQTVQAEFPSFDAWASFRVFNGGAFKLSDGELQVDVERLSLLCGKAASSRDIRSELSNLEPMVIEHKRAHGCEALDAWAAVLRRVVQGRTAFGCKSLAKVLYRRRGDNSYTLTRSETLHGPKTSP